MNMAKPANEAVVVRTPQNTANIGADFTEISKPFLIRLFSILRRRRLTVAIFTVFALMMGIALALILPRQFTASSTIEIQRESNSYSGNQDAQRQSSMLDQEFYQTQYGLLRARTLAERVATTLNLQDKRQFFDDFGVATDKLFDEPKTASVARAERIRTAGEILLKSISIEPDRLSRLVTIRFTGSDPKLTQQVVNTWGGDYIKLTLERRYDATSYSRKFLEDRLAYLRKRIDESERTLVDYASREGIVNLPAGAANGSQSEVPERSLAADDLLSLNQELASATADRVQAQSRLSGLGGQVSEGLQNSAINNLRQARAEKSAEYSKLMVQFQPDYPPAKALRSELAQLDRSITAEEARVSGTLRQSYTAAQTREAALAAKVELAKHGVLDLRRRSIQYNIIQRDADTNRQLYDALLQRYKEIGIAGGVGLNNISVVDAAILPVKPSSPRVLLIMAISLAIGLFLGVAVAFVMDEVDQGINDPSQVNTQLGLPLIGTVPLVKNATPIDALNDAKSALTEAYHSLQISLSFATDHGMPTSLAVTSTRPSEGKSTSAFAIARLLARSGKKVILVDSDMRIPRIASLLSLTNVTGLSSYLSGDDKLDGMVQSLPDIANLDVLTSGPIPPSSPELLVSDRFEGMVKHLLKTYDHVILDAPPVLGLADTPIIGGKIEGILFVIEAHATPINTARNAIKRLIAASTRVVGVAVVKFDVERADSAYNYSYYSNYTYEYGRSDKHG